MYSFTLNIKLKYSLHIDLLYIKLSKIIYLFKKLSFLNLQILILLYNSFFLYLTFLMVLKYRVITIKKDDIH